MKIENPLERSFLQYLDHVFHGQAPDAASGTVEDRLTLDLLRTTLFAGARVYREAVQYPSGQVRQLIDAEIDGFLAYIQRAQRVAVEEAIIASARKAKAKAQEPPQ